MYVGFKSLISSVITVEREIKQMLEYSTHSCIKREFRSYYFLQLFIDLLLKDVSSLIRIKLKFFLKNSTVCCKRVCLPLL